MASDTGAQGDWAQMGIGMGRTMGLRLAGVIMCFAGLAVGLSACGGGTEPQVGIGPSLRCVDDSVACVTQRQSALRSMMADRERRWVREPASVDAYAGGVRLFAYKTKKKELSCGELASGRREADAGPGVLRGPSGRHLTPAQVSRGVMLANEVSRELHTEMQRRCPA